MAHRCSRLGQLARIGLLVLDDFLLTPPSVIEAKDLLEVIDDRSQVRSTLVVSQLPVEAWHPALAGGDLTLADAILDRLLSRIRDKSRYSERGLILTSGLGEVARPLVLRDNHGPAKNRISASGARYRPGFADNGV